MRRYLLYLTLIFFAFFTFVNSTSKCTEGEDGFMYCEDISSQGQNFLKNDSNNEIKGDSKNEGINSDIVFLVDESKSMCKYINTLKSKVQDLLDELSKEKINARFSVIGFGGKPRIYSAFTDDTKAINDAFNKLNCIHGDHESGLETIRMFLKKSKKFINKIEDIDGSDNFIETNKLNWRRNSSRTIVLITDEDSDIPYYEENRNKLQIKNSNNELDIKIYDGKQINSNDVNKFVGFPYHLDKDQASEYSFKYYIEPAFSPAILTSVNNVYTFYRSGSPLVLSKSYQKEVDETANLIIAENVQLIMLLSDNLMNAQGPFVSNSQFNKNNPYWQKEYGSWLSLIIKKHESDDSSTITAQYGNPGLDDIKKTSLERDEIYVKLVEKKQEKSLQGQILSNEGFCRAFKIDGIIDNENMIKLFYKNIVSSVKSYEINKLNEEEEELKNLEKKEKRDKYKKDNISFSTSISDESTTKTIFNEEATTTPATTPTTTPIISGEETPISYIRYKNVTVCDDDLVETKEINSDIVFIIDESGSMCKYIDPLRKKLSSLIEELKKVKANARFAIIGFGGKPRIYSAFTDDIEVIQESFYNLDCDESGQESGLEAIRMFLNKSKNFINRIEKVNSEKNFVDIDKLEWREKSTRTIILVTDEDSDLPIYEENRNDLQIENIVKKSDVDISMYEDKDISQNDIEKFMGFPYYLNKEYMPNYNSDVFFEPSFSPAILTSVNGIYTLYRSGTPLVLSDSYQKEVDETAQLIINNNIQLFMLLSDNLIESQGVDVSNSQFNNRNPYWANNHFTESDESSTINAQYGNPLLDSIRTIDLRAEEIYSKLKDKNQEKSLQGQVLNMGGFCRAFNLKDFTSEQSDSIVELFYRNVVKAVETCTTKQVPYTEEEEEEVNNIEIPGTTTTSTFATLYTIEPTVLPPVPYKNITVCNDEEVENREINADIVFIIDESASMCKYIDAMRNKLNILIDELYKVNANARYAIIGFGGKPRLYASFTKEEKVVEEAFSKLNCQQSGQESGLEAIRMFLNNVDYFVDWTGNNYGIDNFSDINEIKWREGSTKTIILLTDEDSDLPIYKENRNTLQIENLTNVINLEEFDGKDVDKKDVESFVGFPYYLSKNNLPEYGADVFFEPSFSPAILTSVDGVYTFYRNGQPIILSEAYQKEVDETAQLIIKDSIQLFLLLNDDLFDSQGSDVSNSQFSSSNPLWVNNRLSDTDDSSTITSQYGNPLLDSIAKQEFEREEIYDKLVTRKQEKSLQGQILLNGGFCRAFNMKEFTSGQSEKMVELFYKNVVRTVQKCVISQELICENGCTECDYYGCTACEDHRVLKNHKCECDVHYYESNNECLECDEGCSKCTSEKCIECTSEFRNPDKKGKCKCKDGYYEDIDESCKACDVECATCNRSGSCTTCKDKRAIISDGKCVCQYSYMQKNGICFICDESCAECNKNGCVACYDPTKTPDSNGKC
ncbi:hypothetical protein H8356DRAFT_989729 [Neocallimastix lanati (nom. inval.)]|uniref:VWFA domain-containing protein n=1 Tax=Neocallimastix californiae TaxID=1754190 RepID=A0A1Y2ACQ9_9FUNG|nr:hypothetical protein H8356DRAFT_989729 [Neocallimastix sp. JGI-2020a]ORY20070.1 hypothetical protein LY90DRAFT_676979 [Neocallimastix californiae]|eukprot:ORY20070.1 hypothetical protein LY90DRAFT_676979 [Neocallimastix californiae]